MYQLISDLYPICRSITGDGVRESLKILRQRIPLETHEVPTGTEVFDWTIPKEWNIRDAYIKNAQGERIIDFQQHNLHVVNYSIPVKQHLSLSELRSHLFTLPEHPDWIPYRTSYYQETWGFCLSYHQWLALTDDLYEVCIDSSLRPGFLTYGEFFLPGQSTDEVLISCHTCHPSLCNDNLSGVSLATLMAQTLSSLTLRYSYRFVFLPGTIGALTWLSCNEDRITNIRHGLVLANVGDAGSLTYKRSRHGNTEIDRAVCHVLQQTTAEYEICEFSPYGYDERQYCSPGFNLPVGRLTRTPPGRFPEYHTSADNLEFVHPHSLADSFMKVLAVIAVLEGNGRYMNQHPKGEPQLGKRGLYHALGGQTQEDHLELAMLWVLNASDGSQSLLDIAERSGLAFTTIKHAATLLESHQLLQPC
ncbi:MAG: DUF4910 domain-containing protein [Candidatus Binatia bacterium]